MINFIKTATGFILTFLMGVVLTAHAQNLPARTKSEIKHEKKRVREQAGEADLQRLLRNKQRHNEKTVVTKKDQNRFRRLASKKFDLDNQLFDLETKSNIEKNQNNRAKILKKMNLINQKYPSVNH